MDNDRSWMQVRGFSGRQQEIYRKGVREFLDFAFKDVAPNLGKELPCPCVRCQNSYAENREVMRIHLLKFGIEPTYNPWVLHGEEESLNTSDEENEDEDDSYDDEDNLISDEIVSMIRDATNVIPETVNLGETSNDELPEKFQRLMNAAEDELYPGCKTFSKLEFIVTLLYLKVSGRWSDKSFTGLLDVLHKAFNFDASFPKSSEQAKKYTKDLGLNYIKIHACVNHCTLFWKKNVDADMCPVCHEPRYQEGACDADDSAPYSESQGTSQRKRRVPRLVLMQSYKQLTHAEWKQAQIYVLRNCLEVQPFMKEYESLHEPGQDFVEWFGRQIWKLHTDGDTRATKELLSLARGPSSSVVSYPGYFVNRFRFHTKKRQRRRKTQNSGVVVKGDEESGGRDFFGVLKEVIELEYDAPNIGQKQPIVVLFRCDWFDVYSDGRGIKKDKFGTISVNTRKLLGTDEPFALASQVGQVYYVRAHNEPDWRIVIKTIPRYFYYWSWTRVVMLTNR